MISPERSRIKALFFEAAELDPAGIPAFLDRACAGEPALRAEVESLLGFHDEAPLIVEAAPGGVDLHADPLGIVGARVGKSAYAVERFVDEGGFGYVYFARAGAHPIALKVFKPLRADTGALERAFRKEAELLRDLSEKSPAIVRAREVDTLTTAAGDEHLFFSLEWLEGAPLSAQPRRPRPLDEVLDLLEPAAAALEIAHAAGVAHRDIKPANLFLTEGGLKVLDFGVAKVAAEGPGGFSATTTGIAAVTADYAAPEQLTGARTGPWTDVYALALVVVELLLGRAPYAEQSPLEVMMAVPDPARRPTPRALGLEVPDAVEATLARALAVPADARFHDAGEFWGALRSARATGPTGP